jgi:hypothetical protein
MWDAEVVRYTGRAGQPGFAAHLAGLPDNGPVWAHATLPEERGLEQWMHGLAGFGRRAWTQAAVATAREIYRDVLARVDPMMGLDLGEGAPSMDGESAGTQVARVEAWLAALSPETAAAVAASIDPTRQLSTWDEDLNPPEDSMWCWYVEVGQLTAMAAQRKDDGDPGQHDAYHWPAAIAGARAAVCALKAIRLPGGSVTADVERLGAAIARAFGG